MLFLKAYIDERPVYYGGGDCGDVFGVVFRDLGSSPFKENRALYNYVPKNFHPALIIVLVVTI